MPAPLAHISGLLNVVLTPGAAGMGAVLQQRWDPEHGARLCREERVTTMFGPPAFFLGLRDASTPVTTLRLISSGGTGITPEFVQSTAEAFGCVVKRTYGSTEAPTVSTAHEGDPPEKAWSTDGRATGAIELRLAAAGTGELEVRGPELFVGYADPAQTAAAFTDDGFYRTGDLATIDDDGWLTITGRLKDVIIRGGENVTTSEVESVCEAHPAVREAVAVGMPDERLGERVAVVVVLVPGAGTFDVPEAQRWFEAQGIARFKTPEHVEVVDAIPLLAAGKPDRKTLATRLRHAGP
jgi:cyclohexanecarboxylate-CoA ligase